MALDQTSYHDLDIDPNPLQDDRFLCMAHDGNIEAEKEYFGDLAPYMLEHDPPLNMKFHELRANQIVTTPSDTIPEKYSHIVNNTPAGDLSVKHTPNFPNQFWATIALKNGSVHRVKEWTTDIYWDVPDASKLGTDNYFWRDAPQYPEFNPVVTHRFSIAQNDTLAFKIRKELPYHSIWYLTAYWRIKFERIPLLMPNVYPVWGSLAYFNNYAHGTEPIRVGCGFAKCIPGDVLDGYTLSFSTIFRIPEGYVNDIYIAPTLKWHFIYDFWYLLIIGKPYSSLVEYRTSLFRIA